MFLDSFAVFPGGGFPRLDIVVTFRTWRESGRAIVVKRGFTKSLFFLRNRSLFPRKKGKFSSELWGRLRCARAAPVLRVSNSLGLSRTDGQVATVVVRFNGGIEDGVIGSQIRGQKFERTASMGAPSNHIVSYFFVGG